MRVGAVVAVGLALGACTPPNPVVVGTKVRPGEAVSYNPQQCAGITTGKVDLTEGRLEFCAGKAAGDVVIKYKDKERSFSVEATGVRTDGQAIRALVEKALIEEAGMTRRAAIEAAERVAERFGGGL